MVCCDVCGETKDILRCSKCKKAFYCQNKGHQERFHPYHRETCGYEGIRSPMLLRVELDLVFKYTPEESFDREHARMKRQMALQSNNPTNLERIQQDAYETVVKSLENKSTTCSRETSIANYRALIVAYVPDDEQKHLSETTLEHLSPWYVWSRLYDGLKDGESPAFAETSKELFNFCCLVIATSEKDGEENLDRGGLRLRETVKDLKKRKVKGWQEIEEIVDEWDKLKLKAREALAKSKRERFNVRSSRFAM